MPGPTRKIRSTSGPKRTALQRVKEARKNMAEIISFSDIVRRNLEKKEDSVEKYIEKQNNECDRMCSNIRARCSRDKVREMEKYLTRINEIEQRYERQIEEMKRMHSTYMKRQKKFITIDVNNLRTKLTSARRQRQKATALYDEAMLQYLEFIE